MESIDFVAMKEGKPRKAYRKAILAKVYVNVINPFSGKPEGRILFGEGDESIVELWTEKEIAFFEQMNKKHLDAGNLIPYEHKTDEEIEAEKYNSLSDEELEKIIGSKFFTLKAALGKMTSPAPVARLLKIAENKEKSEKVLNTIRARLSELEMG